MKKHLSKQLPDSGAGCNDPNRTVGWRNIANDVQSRSWKQCLDRWYGILGNTKEDGKRCEKWTRDDHLNLFQRYAALLAQLFNTTVECVCLMQQKKLKSIGIKSQRVLLMRLGAGNEVQSIVVLNGCDFVTRSLKSEARL